jgi:alpha-tubulin suppressor-like RCC1 family protein
LYNDFPDFLKKIEVQKIKASNEHSMILTQAGKVIAFGSNQQG